MNDINVIDDVIPLEMQDAIEDLLLGDKLDWRFKQDLTRMRKEIKETKATDLSPFWWISFLEDVNGFANHGILRKLQPIVEHSCARLNVKLKKLLQGRTFLVPPLPDHLRREYVNVHVDTKTDHWVCLYYVNDADGETVLFEQTTTEVNAFESHNNKVTFTELQRISPKKGRCVVFNGNRYHSASSPAKHTRCVINFNFLMS